MLNIDGNQNITLTRGDTLNQYVIELWRAPKGNLNIDGWGLDQQWMKMCEDIQSNTHKLT